MSIIYIGEQYAVRVTVPLKFVPMHRKRERERERERERQRERRERGTRLAREDDCGMGTVGVQGREMQRQR